jgi:uncharacterized membrane protein
MLLAIEQLCPSNTKISKVWRGAGMKYGCLFIVIATIIAGYSHVIDRIGQNNKTVRVFLTAICIILLFAIVLLVDTSLEVL